MLNDKFSNPIFEDEDLFQLVYQGYTDFSSLLVEDSENIKKFEHYSSTTLKKFDKNLENVSVEEYDTACQSSWFIPEEYKNMDIESYLVHICPKQHYQRLIEELQEYRARNLLPLLTVLKYLVDEFRKNKILWGVGRGSSIASYVLFLLEIHKIDSIKYNLDWREFLR